MDIRRIEKRASLSEDIAGQLYAAILSGSLKPGDLLPGQRELADRFGASIATVREAISVLVAAGILSANPGRGTVIQGIDSDGSRFHGWLGAPYDENEVFELIEARLVLETFFVRKAAGTLSSDALAELEEYVARMEQHVDDPEPYLEADAAFHRSLARCGRNSVLVRVVRALEVPIMHMCRPANEEHMKTYGDLRVSLATHKRLIEAMKSGDANEAVSCLEEMAGRTRVTFQRYRDAKENAS